MKKAKFILLVTVVMSVLVALPSVGCAPGVPPTEKTVIYLSLADYTGPIAGLNVPADMGCQDMFKEINAQGGVDGVKIEFIGVDTRYDVARGVSAYKRYRAEPNLFVTNVISTGMSRAILPITAKDKVIQLTAGDGEAQAFIGWIFLWGPTYQNQFGAAIDFLMEDWKTKGKLGMPTIGTIGWDNPYGREPLRGGREYAEKLGIKLLPPEFFPPGAPDHTVWLMRLAAGNPDYILLTGVVDPTPSTILRDAYRLGLTKEIQFIDPLFCGPTESAGIKLHPEAVEGCWMNCFYLRGDEAWSHPLATVIVPKYRKKSIEEVRKEIAPQYLAGMGWALTYKEALSSALKAVGYDKLDGEAMKTAYESLTGMEANQGLTGPCAYSPTSRQNTNVVRFYQVRNGKEVPISGWRKVPDCVSLYDWSK